MKLILFVVLTLVPLGFLTKDIPSEAELVAEYATLATFPPAPTSTTTTTTEAPRTALTVAVTTMPSTTVYLPVADGAKCPAWWDTAVSMGWPAELLPTLDRVMWNESRCQPDATNGADHGLVQVNWATWQHLVKGLGYTKQSLYVPAINLLVGRLIYQAAVDANYRCPWSPWYMSGDYCD